MTPLGGLSPHVLAAGDSASAEKSSVTGVDGFIFSSIFSSWPESTADDALRVLHLNA
jgi:hypothetical protein